MTRAAPLRSEAFRRLAVAGAALLFVGGCAGLGSAAGDWAAYGGSPEGDRFSPLSEIRRSNVGRLQEVWRVETGEGGLQTSPLAIGGVLYVLTPDQVVLALDGATGRELWRHRPEARNRQPIRGLSYWRDGAERRLFTSHGTFLTALDPATGQPAAGFGRGGTIDLREGLGREPSTLPVFLTTPGVVFRDLLIVGFRTSETAPAAPGAIRAYDVRNGQLRWTFALVPKPEDPGAETWPAEALATAGGANAWAGLALDPERGIVYAPTGSAVDDFFGGDRKGDNLFANSLVALDAATGRRLWHQQLVRHDILDRDLPSPPSLLMVRRGGRTVPAVAQATKHGFLFVFDRVTGEPLFPIEQRSVPASDVPGEWSSTKQPFPVAPEAFARQQLTADMLTKRTPEAAAAARAAFDRLRRNGPFAPLAVDAETLVFPGFDGGAEWGGSAVERERGIVYLNANDVAWTGSLRAARATNRGAGVYQKQCAVCHGADGQGAEGVPAMTGLGGRLSLADIRRVILEGRGRMPGFPQIGSPDLEQLIHHLADPSGAAGREVQAADARVGSRYTFNGYRKFLDPDGYPAVEPPWGTLNAIDLNSGRYRWRVPLGEYPELVARGVPATGSENYGGPVVTAGGLLFIGATVRDRKLRAFDTRNGRILWEGTLPYPGAATPVTYLAGGRQFVVIAASSPRDPKAPPGSAYLAFALPDVGKGAQLASATRRD